MTEAEWFACADPTPMLDISVYWASERKRRLLAVAFCRRIWSLLKDDRSRAAVEVAERHADGWATREELTAAFERAADPSIWNRAGGWLPTMAAGYTAGDLTYKMGVALRWVQHNAAMASDDIPAAWSAQCHLIRDIFGNPCRVLAVDPRWLTPTVTTLARGVYEERAFDRLPILADALQDAGCDHADVLDHCRDGQLTHVRGCWVVDLILGKE